MPPRISPTRGWQPLNVLALLQSLPTAPAYGRNGVCASCSFTLSAKGPMTHKKRNKSRLKPHRDPYRDAQANQRKAANIARQQVLKEQRTKAMGDPIRSLPTPFIKSLATGGMPGEAAVEGRKNYFLKPGELSDALRYSKNLSAPYIPEPEENQHAIQPSAASGPSESEFSDPPRRPPPIDAIVEERLEAHEEDHSNATRALDVITSLDTGSSADLTRYNIQRCIDTFGRQSTDKFLPPKPASIYNRNPVTAKMRAGPDTGSSEVQVAILTARINTLASNLHNNDKQNKRSLRLLLHKRQKHLAYLRRKERAGPRWHHLVDKLGIQDAMWKGEITLP